VTAEERSRPDDAPPPLDAKTTTVFVVSAVLLTLFYYYGRSDFYRRKLVAVFDPHWPAAWADFIGLTPYVWWATTSLVLRVAVPVAVIVLLFREPLSAWGFRLRGQLRHGPAYLGLYVAMLPFLYWASLRPSFQSQYPFYGPAREGGWQFVTYELLYLPQFIGVEVFFRGFMLFGLARKLGYHAVFVSVIPYVMIHFNKPIAETLGAVIAGTVLGVLALRSGSFVWGVALHCAIAVTMDLMAIYRAAAG